MAINKTPKWQHDCEECIFLGQTLAGVDYYYHPRDSHTVAGFDELVARYSDEPSDYWSGEVVSVLSNLHIYPMTHDARVCLRLARSKGFNL